MTATILPHPKLLAGRAAEIARALREPDTTAIVRCADCRHAVPYDRCPKACWCLCYRAERSVYSPRECGGFEARLVP